MGKMTSSGVEAVDQTICCNALRTGVKRTQLSGALIWERMPGNYRLFSTQTTTNNVRMDVTMFSSGSCTSGFYLQLKG